MKSRPKKSRQSPRQLERHASVSLSKLWQLVVAFAESLQAHRKADSFLRRLENNEGRSLPAAQLFDQIVVHYHLGHAAARQAAHETGTPDVLIVDLETKAGRQQDAKRGYHPHQAALLVRGLEHDDREPDIRPGLRCHALHQRTLLALCAGRRIATDLPIAMHGFDRTLGTGAIGRPRNNENGSGQQHGGQSPDRPAAFSLCNHELPRSAAKPPPADLPARSMRFDPTATPCLQGEPVVSRTIKVKPLWPRQGRGKVEQSVCGG